MPVDEGPEEQYGDYGDYESVDPAAQAPDEAQEPAPEPEQDEPEYQPYSLAEARPSPHDEAQPQRLGPLRDEEGKRLPEFDQRYRDDFTGLAYIGALSKQFSWLGHRFVIRTLTSDEYLAAAVVTKEWQNTIGAPMAYKIAMTSLCVVEVDGKDLPVPLGPEDSANYGWAFQRFNYAKARWFNFTIDAIYEQFLELEEKTAAVVEAMGKAYGPTGSTPGLSTNSA